MFGDRNVTRDMWRAVVVAGAMLGAGALGCSSAARPPAGEPTAVPPEDSSDNSGERQEMGTGSALGESLAPAASATDAGVPDAAPAAPAPKKRPRSEGNRPSGRGLIIA